MQLKDKINKIYDSPSFPIIVFMAAIFLMICRIQVLPGNDDSWFQAGIADQGVLQWVFNRYFNWSGRVSVELVLGLVNYNMVLWKILNTLMSGALILVISKFILSDSDTNTMKRNIIIFICCSFFFFYPYEITSSIVWCTGSFYYLWTVTAMLCALLPFYNEILGRKTKYKITYWAYFISSFYAAYFEQTSAILVCFGLITLIYLIVNKIKVKRILAIQYLFILLNFGIAMLAPGTKVRSIQEIHWYPNYENISLIQRVFESINWTNTHILITSSIFTLSFLGMIVYICRKKYDSKIIRFFSVIPAIFVLVRMIPFNNLTSRLLNYQHNLFENPYQDYNKEIVLDIEGALDKLFYTPMSYLNDETSQFARLIPAIVCLSVVLFIAILIAYCFKRKEEQLVYTLLYLAALAASYIMFISPTIYASGNRIFFVGDCIILIIGGNLLKQIFSMSSILENRAFIKIKHGVIFITFIMFCTYLTTFVTQSLAL